MTSLEARQERWIPAQQQWLCSPTPGSPTASPAPLSSTPCTKPKHTQKMKTNRAITSWYQDLSHWQGKASNPNSCHHLSPARILAAIRSAKPGAGRHNNLWHTGSSRAQKAPFQPSRLCWMTKQRLLQSQRNFSTLAVKLIFKRMARTTALVHSDHFLRF